jgi:hypothetical protein
LVLGIEFKLKGKKGKKKFCPRATEKQFQCEPRSNEIMDEMARMIPASAKGQKVWDTFWSTAEKEGKFKRIIRDETARRVTDAALLAEFGLAGLLVRENTSSVSMGVPLVTECKLVEDFLRRGRLLCLRISDFQRMRNVASTR